MTESEKYNFSKGELSTKTNKNVYIKNIMSRVLILNVAEVKKRKKKKKRKKNRWI